MYDAPELAVKSKSPGNVTKLSASSGKDLSYCVSQGYAMAGQKGSILICATDQEYEEVRVPSLSARWVRVQLQ